MPSDTPLTSRVLSMRHKLRPQKYPAMQFQGMEPAAWGLGWLDWRSEPEARPTHPITPKISVPFGECLAVVCLVVVEAPAGVGLRYLAGRHPACA